MSQSSRCWSARLKGVRNVGGEWKEKVVVVVVEVQYEEDMWLWVVTVR